MVMQQAQEAQEAGAIPSQPSTNARAFPHLPDGLGMLYVALSVVIMAFSSLFTVFPILAFLLLWFRHIFYKNVFILSPSSTLAATLAFPFLCCYSTFWSDYPLTTLYHGTELMTLAVSTVIMMRIVRAKPLIKGMLLGITIAMGITLASGHYEEDSLTKVRSLLGFFGSKNEVGFFSEIGIYLSLLLLANRTTFFEKILFSFVPIAICSVSLYLCKSATSVASLAILLSLCGGACVIMKVRREWRILVFIGAALCLIIISAIVAATHFDIISTTLDLLGKNSTLTGRTYLWSEGLKNGMGRPVLGYGYAAFWVPGRPQAEQYWYEFLVDTKIGFHFHNLFIQTFVDLGVIGFLLVAWMLIAICSKGLRLIRRQGLTWETGFVFGLSLMFLLRSCFEVDILESYGMGPLLFFSLMSIPPPARKAVMVD